MARKIDKDGSLSALAGGKPLLGMDRLRQMVEAELVGMAGSPEQQAELGRCANDVVYWVDKYGRTYDPRTKGKSLPFRLYPKQVQFLDWLRRMELRSAESPPFDCLCDKSRGVGVSFLCGAYALHGWLFKPGYKVGFGSRKLEYVDEIGNLDSIFEKIRFMIRHLPAWMLPPGFSWISHSNHTRLINPDTHAAIVGEGGDQIGRGGRNSIYFVDEAAFLERPHLTDASLAENTDFRVDVSTPNGPGNPFAVKRHSLPPDRVFTFHWRDDPRKNEEWAERTKREKGPTVFAAEYDIDYSASVEGITIPGAWVRAAVNLKLPGCGVGVGRCVAGQDIGDEGESLSVFITRWGPVVNRVITWGRMNTTDTAFRMRDEALKAHCVDVCYDVIGVGAGVKGTIAACNRGEGPGLPFTIRGINVGDKPTETVWPDGETSQHKFENLKAELWWCLRTRFEKAYEYVTKGVNHPPEEMISIPNHPQLIAELSLPLHFKKENGKIIIESKDKLKKRGVKSPDHAEALTLSEAAVLLRPKQFWLR